MRKVSSSNSQWDDRLHEKQQSLLWSCKRHHYFKGSSKGEEAGKERVVENLHEDTKDAPDRFTEPHAQVNPLVISQSTCPGYPPGRFTVHTPRLPLLPS